jgi:signal transduction histidine kinase
MSWVAGVRGRSRQEVLWGALVLGGLCLFVVVTYVVIVLGGGVIVGRADSPDLALSVLATAVVALAFDPVQTRLENFASRTVKGGDPAPYEVLRRFSGTATGGYPAEELPARMARVLAEGTGAAWAQVWLVVDDRPQLAATWPPRAVDLSTPEGSDPFHAGDPSRRARPVNHGGELLGVLVVQERENVPLTTIEERLFAGLAGQAGLVLRGARLRADLELRLAELSVRADELRHSRERLVDAQDAERRRLERDIHDGAQQHLVALAVNLRLADTLAGRSPDRADTLLAAQEDAAAEAVATLVRLARGIYPPLLEEQGVAAALRSVITGSGRPIAVDEHGVGRYPARVEAAAYFSCLEALQNAVKHAGAGSIRVMLEGRPDELAVSVEDDGAGFDPASTAAGAGLANIRDRVESVGGTVRIESAPGTGTRLHAAFPMAAMAAPALTTDGGA